MKQLFEVFNYYQSLKVCAIDFKGQPVGFTRDSSFGKKGVK